MLVDFRSIQQDNMGVKNIYTVSDFDDTTCLYYKYHRIKKTDPISYCELNGNNAFKFYNMWDPNTGNRLDPDPFGPLYFSPITLLRHYHMNCLNNLWIDQSDESDGTYSGYYGDGVGAGEDIEVVGRGIYPEKYLFRLPVNNCYLKKNYDWSIITMGPKLTNDEIANIDILLTKYWKDDHFYKKVYRKIRSLQNLKYYYDIAISKNPVALDLSKFSQKDHTIMIKSSINQNELINRRAVDMIKRLSK